MFYVFIRTEDPDGGLVELREMKDVNSMEEAKTRFEDEQLKRALEWGEDENDFRRQRDYIVDNEVNWLRVAFLEVNQIEEFNMDEFKQEMAQKFQILIDKQKEYKEREEYDRLKQKFGNNMSD